MLIHLQDRLNFASPIVIVDESEEFVRDMAEHLRKEYFPLPVIGHSTAHQAAALIARERPSLLICNQHMPRVGGMALITMTRKRWGDLPTVVLVSAGQDPGSGEQADGATIYVEKSVGLAALCDRIADLPGAPPRSFPASLADTPGQKKLHAVEAPLLAKEWQVTPVVQQFERKGVDVQLMQARSHSRIDDYSWSSETPLPPHWTNSFDDEDHASLANEIISVLDDGDIEFVEHQDGNRRVDNDPSNEEEIREMALTASNVKENLAKLESIEGFVGAALADSDSGMCIGFLGGGTINLEIAAAANAEVMRSKRKAMKALNLRDDIEDILITLGKQYHLIRPVRSRTNLFFYLMLDRQRANLAMARFTLSDTERELPM